ncbi:MULTISPECIES: hypothetical protein [Marinomonas]|uniref:Phage holin family protein n=1 Tax=Marinomonas arctica TaxID=383750 RepID=A0A7H1J333_9GAMM|nr:MULTISPECIES: hypothetical protein [Marinomonas]MCS7485873.1 hypothetical protein [Marinomonas sp. BSi20414]QNT04899.1 hypothetical protein IBG28_14490 [Marinomonas arctica]GGN17681.1 hypothetical protein GCM10011350_03400 [Marinomonas arctica]
MEAPHSEPQQAPSDLDAVAEAHKSWLKSVLGLGALEAKLWVASSAQLLALMCGVVFLILTTWLLIIATGAAVAWSYGFSLVGILLTATLITFISAVVLLYLVKRTLEGMNFTRTLDAIIPTDED